MKKILDLGCGRNKKEGAIGMDSAPLPGVDYAHNLLEFPYPFADESFEEIIISHVLEHFEFSDMVKILNEAHRLLAPNGIVSISVPHAYTIAAIAPQHRTFFTFGYFDYFDSRHPFSYYAEITRHWEVSRRTASVNIFNDHVLTDLPRHRAVQAVEAVVSRGLSYIARRKIYNLADFLCRILPVWLVSIHWVLKKEIKN